MLVIEPSYHICLNMYDVEYERMLSSIDGYGHVCYKFSILKNNSSRENFIRKLIKNSHESVLEHCIITVIITCDRGVSHELVRHRIASYSQESTRYCNYSNNRLGNQITFIKPVFFPELKCGVYEDFEPFLKYSEKDISIWGCLMLDAERAYFSLLNNGRSPEEARSVLPNSLKTEIVVTQNIRQWRHFFKLRALGTTGKPHPQMLEITVPMLKDFKKYLPVFFEDLEEKNETQDGNWVRATSPMSPVRDNIR